MEYERIDKVQTGMISPSKLRLKLMGPHHQKRKDGSNNNSSRTSPSKLEDTEFVKNSLLASNDGDFDEEAPSLESSSVKLSGKGSSNSGKGDQTCSHPKDKEIGEMGNAKIQHLSRGVSGNLSAVHPVRAVEEDSPDYDSNASSSSFEFHKGERLLHNPIVRPYSRPIPSKWNDAEKWIVNRQLSHPNVSKKAILHNQVIRQPMAYSMKVTPESTSSDPKGSFVALADTKRVDCSQPSSQTGLEKFSFVPTGTHPISGPANGVNTSIDLCPINKDDKEMDHKELSVTERSTADTAVFPAIRAVSMRDMGTEMTPMTSLEPSRTATPVEATSPFRSPTSSIPSTPRGGAPAPTPMGVTTDDEAQCQKEGKKNELSEQELKLKTRREIVALGVQLGKTNIAAWASKDEKEKNVSSVETVDLEQLDRLEFETRAAEWVEVEKSKHTARYKHEEIRIQAWESRQKAKIEADMRRIEAQVEQMKAHAQEKLMKKMAITRQKSEEKRAIAEAKRNQQAAKTAAQAEYIRQTGRIPASHFLCCSWVS